MPDFVQLYALGAGVSWLLIAGMDFAYFQGEYPRFRRDWRRDLVSALVAGFVGGLIWPIGLLYAWCTLGFAKYGWRLWPAPKSPEGA